MPGAVTRFCTLPVRCATALLVAALLPACGDEDATTRATFTVRGETAPGDETPAPLVLAELPPATVDRGAPAGASEEARDGATPHPPDDGITSPPDGGTANRPDSAAETPALVFPWQNARRGEWGSYVVAGGARQQWVVLEAGRRQARCRVTSVLEVPGAVAGTPGERVVGPEVQFRAGAEDGAFPHPARATTEAALACESITLSDGTALDCVRVEEGETITWYSEAAPCDGVVRRVRSGARERELLAAGIGEPR